MGERPDSEEHAEANRSDVRDELRTIAFRLRELQRLMSVRVQQENRRLEADGIDPVTEATFFKRFDEHRAADEDATRYLIETLGALDVFEEAHVTLADGTTVQGRVNPIRYEPNERLRLEIRPRGGDVRYELRAEYADGRWSTPVVRRYVSGDDDWTEVGELDALRALE